MDLYALHFNCRKRCYACTINTIIKSMANFFNCLLVEVEGVLLPVHDSEFVARDQQIIK